LRRAVVSKLSALEHDLPPIRVGLTFCKANPCKKPDGRHFHPCTFRPKSMTNLEHRELPVLQLLCV
jgi:hypothetical protein